MSDHAISNDTPTKEDPEAFQDGVDEAAEGATGDRDFVTDPKALDALWVASTASVQS